MSPSQDERQPGFFTDRHDAGRRLARALAKHRGRSPVVLALPRGGVPVGLEVARALDAPLDLVLVRKIGVPGQPELAAAAVVDGARPELVRNEEVLRFAAVPEDWLERERVARLAEIERRRARYLGGRAPVGLAGRTAIVVDDGLATGTTALAAVKAVRRAGPGWLVLAVPVAPAETLARLEGKVDEIVCLSAPSDFHAIGQFYGDFTQLSDEKVVELLGQAKSGDGG